MAGENDPKTAELASSLSSISIWILWKQYLVILCLLDIDFEASGEQFNVKIGIANDSAFCFYYQDTFDDLKKHGAELVFF